MQSPLAVEPLGPPVPSERHSPALIHFHGQARAWAPPCTRAPPSATLLPQRLPGLGLNATSHSFPRVSLSADAPVYLLTLLDRKPREDSDRISGTCHGVFPAWHS